MTKDIGDQDKAMFDNVPDKASPEIHVSPPADKDKEESASVGNATLDISADSRGEKTD